MGGCEDGNLETLQRRLREKLDGKRYLLVLDDVWKANQQDWEELRGILNCGSRGASVIVTTRLQTVASIMGTLPQCNLYGLSEDECWSLFKQRAFTSRAGAESREESPQLVAIGKEIVRKCGGVPLAAKALGSLMRSKATEQEWQRVKESEIWDLRQDDDDENPILPALRLSYVNLRAELRQCFAYCSVFSKDSEMEKEKIIQMWMANGFIGSSSKGNVDPEDIGDEIWRQLYWTSFFQDVENDKFGDVQSFKMHDLVHDLATSMVDDQYKKPATLMSPGDTNLRTYISGIMEFESMMNAGDWSSLRVLVMDDISEVGMSKLRNLKHLRYLDLSWNVEIRTLPNSICELVNLQTLNLNGCRSLENLPRGITGLKSLRHLYLDECDSLRLMPPGIGELKNLKTLTLFVVDGRRGCGLDELQELDLGGKLVIKGLDQSVGNNNNNNNNVRAAAGIYLGRKQKIRELELHWAGESESSQGNVVEQLHQLMEALQPHPNLPSLTIEGYGGSSFPSWMGIPILQNLRFLKLSHCNNCQHLPPLGQLPSLEYLEMEDIEKVRQVEDDLNAYGGLSSSSSVMRFPSLKVLSIKGLPCLEKLSEARDGDAFPRLSRLSIGWGCGKLRLPCILSLKHLEVWDCSSVLLASISNLPHLTSLVVSGNSEDVCFPEGILQSLTSLQSLTVSNFRKLQVLPTQLQNHSALKSLNIRWCDELESLPEAGIEGLKSLQELRLEVCRKLKCLPEALPRLTALESLILSGLSALTSLPHGLGKLTSLQSLQIWKCPKFAYEEAIEALNSLQRLRLGGCPELTSLPQPLQHLTALQSLHLSDLSNLTSLPDWLGKLTSLQSLQIWGCPKLASLPHTIQSLTNLNSLEIYRCAQLESRYHRERGEEYHKIAHIPRVEIW